MAPKPKKMTDADKAKLKKLAAGKGARSDGKLTSDQKLELLGLRDMERKSRSYSPKPMTAAAKNKAEAAGKATGAKTKPKSLASKVSGAAGKVAKRAKTVAREVRDVKTAFGTSLRDQEQNVRRAAMGVGPTKRNVGGNLKKQIREAGSAIKSGKKGTPSDEYLPSGAYTKGKKRK
jgi:hypothetical protein